MRLLVCGGRDYEDVKKVFFALERANNKKRIETLIHGGQTGADSLAGEWSLAPGSVAEVLVFVADWGALGNAAGPIRNQRMIDEGKPDGAIAFPGGRGTADMVKRLEAAGVAVWRPYG